MFENGFFKVSRELINHPVVQACSNTYFRILITILNNMAYEKQVFDDHGKEIILEPGQLMATNRQIASWCSCRHDDIQRALDKFSKCGILLLEVRHKKTIITISSKYTCNSNNDLIAPTIAPGLRQDCARKKETNKPIKKKIQKEKIPKVAFREFVNLLQIEYDTLLQIHGHDKANEWIDTLNDYKGSKGVEYDSDYHTICQWVRKREKEQKQNQPTGVTDVIF